MILKKLSVKSFGKLKNLNVDLAPGLNIVYGENESGKSTMQSFIKGVFFGLRTKSKKDEISEHEKYEPWDNEEFAGMIEYEVDGREYKAARNFLTNKVSVYNDLWDDVTDQFEIDKKQGSLFAEKHIGMDEEIFEKTIFIRQLGSRIKESKDIADRLLNMQETGMEETSFRSAVETLEGIVRDKIGTEKSSKKPINLINNEIEKLIKEKNEVNLLRKEVSDLEEKIKQKEREREEILNKVEHLKDAKQSFKKDGLLELYNKAKEYESSLETTENEIARLQSCENFPTHFEDKLKEILSDIRNLQQIIDGKRESLGEIEAKLQSAGEQGGSGGDRELIYSAFSDYQAMKDAAAEKNDCQEKLSILNDELGSLSERAKGFGDIDAISREDEARIIEYEKREVELENKLKEIGRIKEESEKLENYIKGLGINLKLAPNSKSSEDGSFSLEDMEQVLSKYEMLSGYRSKIHSTLHEIEKIKHEVQVNDTVLFDLSKFESLPDDIEDQVMKLYDKANSAPVNMRHEIDTLNTKKKVYKYQIATNMLLLIISFGLIGYSVYGTLSKTEIIPIVSGGVGLTVLIFSIVKSVMALSSIKKIKKEIDEKLKIELEGKNNVSDIEKLNGIYKSVDKQDFTSFMKSLYSYKDAAQKVKLLKVDMKLKTQYLESIKDQLKEIQDQMSLVLSSFGVMHDSASINNTDILNLKEKFNKLATDGHLENSNNYLNEVDDKRRELLNQLKRVSGKDNIQLNSVDEIHEKVRLQLEDIKTKLSEIYERLNITDGAELISRVKDGYEIKKEIDLKKFEISKLEESVVRLSEKIANLDQKIKSILIDNAIEFGEELVNDVQIEGLNEKLNATLKTSGEISNLRVLKESTLSEIAKIEEELKRATSEKESILDSALVGSEEEFFDGCRKNEKLKELVNEKSRLINMQEQLLKGENSQSLLEKVASIEDKDVHTWQIESLEDADVQLEEVKKRLDQINEEIINLKNSASNKLIGKPELNEIIEKLESLKERKLELESSKRSAEIAIDVLNETAKQMQKDFAPILQNEISTIIKQITAEKYSQVKANESLNINVWDEASGKIVNVENLSMGTIEQFYLALRIALSNVLGNGNEKLPIIIDDAFVQYDDIRMLNIMEFLMEISKFRQVIMFTCQGREVEAVRKMGREDVNIIELSAI